MNDLNIYVAIFLMSALTYLTRATPLIFLGGRKLSDRLVRFLAFIPVSVLGSLLTYELLFRKIEGEDVLFFSINNYILLAGIATTIFGYFVRSFFGTIVFGMLFLSLLRYFF